MKVLSIFMLRMLPVLALIGRPEVDKQTMMHTGSDFLTPMLLPEGSGQGKTTLSVKTERGFSAV